MSQEPKIALHDGKTLIKIKAVVNKLKDYQEICGLVNIEQLALCMLSDMLRKKESKKIVIPDANERLFIEHATPLFNKLFGL